MSENVIIITLDDIPPGNLKIVRDMVRELHRDGKQLHLHVQESQLTWNRMIPRPMAVIKYCDFVVIVDNIHDIPHNHVMKSRYYR